VHVGEVGCALSVCPEHHAVPEPFWFRAVQGAPLTPPPLRVAELTLSFVTNCYDNTIPQSFHHGYLTQIPI